MRQRSSARPRLQNAPISLATAELGVRDLPQMQRLSTIRDRLIALAFGERTSPSRCSSHVRVQRYANCGEVPHAGDGDHKSPHYRGRIPPTSSTSTTQFYGETNCPQGQRLSVMTFSFPLLNERQRRRQRRLPLRLQRLIKDRSFARSRRAPPVGGRTN